MGSIETERAIIPGETKGPNPSLQTHSTTAVRPDSSREDVGASEKEVATAEVKSRVAVPSGFVSLDIGEAGGDNNSANTPSSSGSGSAECGAAGSGDGETEDGGKNKRPKRRERSSEAPEAAVEVRSRKRQAGKGRG